MKHPHNDSTETAELEMKQSGLMKHVRAHLAKDPALTTEQLMTLIAPDIGGYRKERLRKRIMQALVIVDRENPTRCPRCGRSWP